LAAFTEKSCTKALGYAILEDCINLIDNTTYKGFTSFLITEEIKCKFIQFDILAAKKEDMKDEFIKYCKTLELTNL
jgi:hypothetical protein